MDASDRTALFVRLFAEYNRRIYTFVRALVHEASDADDVFQEVCTVLWRKFDQFESGTDFGAWAFSIVRFEALAFRRRQGRPGRLFSDAFYVAVEEQALATERQSPRQHEALRECLELLSPVHRDLIRRRYEPEATVQSVAEATGRTPNAVYKILRRLHDRLFQCVQQRLEQEERS